MVSRNDRINTNKIKYQPIKNIIQVQELNNPFNILPTQQTSDVFFEGFSIDLNSRIPKYPSGPNSNHIYIDANTGELIIESVNTETYEQIQVELLTESDTIDGVNIS